jgi:hypothetical protein
LPFPLTFPIPKSFVWPLVKKKAFQIKHYRRIDNLIIIYLGMFHVCFDRRWYNSINPGKRGKFLLISCSYSRQYGGKRLRELHGFIWHLAFVCSLTFSFDLIMIKWTTPACSTSESQSLGCLRPNYQHQMVFTVSENSRTSAQDSFSKALFTNEKRR